MRSKLLVRAPRLLSWVALLLVVAELLLVLLSWLLSAMMTEGVRSMLSSEGIRWFFGSFSEVVQTPLLVWLLLPRWGLHGYLFVIVATETLNFLLSVGRLVHILKNEYP